MFNIPTLVVLTETENTGCTIWRLPVYTQRCTKTASGTAFSRSVEKAFFYWKGDIWFDTPVYSWGRNLNHHFLLSFLPITLLIAVTLWQRINTLWLHGVSSLREFTAIGSRFKQFPEPHSAHGHQKNTQGHLSGFCATELNAILRPLECQGWKTTAISLQLSRAAHGSIVY